LESNNNSPAPAGGLATRLLHWMDVRTGVKSLAKKALDEPIPGGARFAYVFGSGLLFIFVLQVITGISLALYYTPTAETAHTSVAYITKQVAGGAFLRSLHSYGSSAMIVVLALHFLQTFFYGSFKGRRELLWISGALLSFLVLGMGFTGYLLPWDQKAYFATAVGTNVAGEMPIIGNLLTRFLRGGNAIGTLTLSRFYVAHVFLIPACIFLFIGAHVLLFRKAGPAGPVSEDPVEPKLATEAFYPRQVLLDMGFALLTMAVLGALSYLRPVTLGPIANPADTHFLPRPEWYYLPMFEWLKFWEGPKVVFGVVILPGLLAMAFFLMPFLDRRLERRPWRRPIPALAVAIVVLGMVYLGIRSQLDDKLGPIAAQLALQQEQEKAYSATAFQPYVESPDGVALAAAPAGPVNPLVGEGKGIFTERGCVGCHGPSGTGTAAAPSLVGVTGKFPEQQLIALLHNPNERMRAGHMPAVTDASPGEMSALLAYLGVVGTRAANVPAVFRVPSPPASGGGIDAAALVRISSSSTGNSGSAGNLPAPAAAGQQMFQERGCFACHGEAGVGGLAPALAPLIAKLPDVKLTQLLRDPNAKMKAGGMPPVAGTAEEIGSLISYLRTLSAPSPARQTASEAVAQEATPAPATPSASPPSVAVTAPAPATPGEIVRTAEVTGHAAGREIFRSQGCIGCHGPNAQGTQLAPSLIGVASKFPGDKLPALLHHPTKKMVSGGMPAVMLDEAQMAELVAYLSSLQAPPTQLPASPHQAPSNTEPLVAATQSPRPASGANKPELATMPRKVALDPLAQRGQLVFQRNACGTCHGVDGLHGTVAAPGLAGTASMLPESTLENMLRHHTARMQKGGMPLTNFSDADRKAIVAYIRSMRVDGDEQKLVASGSQNKKN
jgi:ubiquinol-cytochrome c reductase cytochrome b subunit